MAAWPLEFVFLVIASFYAQAGFAKLSQGGLAWADGYTLQFYLLQDGTEAGAWLAGQLALCRILSVLVLVFELGFPVAIFARRLRPVAFAGGLFFHAGTTVFLDVGFWPLWSLYSLFLPWERILGAAIRRPRSHALRHLPVPS